MCNEGPQVERGSADRLDRGRVLPESRQVPGLKRGVGPTDESSTMKVRLLALVFGLFLVAGTAYAGPLPGGADSDGDGIENAFDNCTNVANPTQTDTNHNGCGDACTANIACDVNGDKSVGTADFLVLRANFGMTVPAGTLGDCAPPPNGAGGTPDFVALRTQFGNTVGPSGITTAQCDTATCRCTPQ
jgi:hypothetical protein